MRLIVLTATNFAWDLSPDKQSFVFEVQHKIVSYVDA